MKFVFLFLNFQLNNFYKIIFFEDVAIWMEVG